MTNKITVEYDSYSYVTHEANSDDEWDRDSTAQDHTIRGIEIAKKGRFYDIEVDFDLVLGHEYYLVYGIYDTGDSFGNDDGLIEFVDLYVSPEKAYETIRKLEKHARSSSGDSYSAKIEMENGQERSFHVPWKGYFEHLQGVYAKNVRLLG